MSGTATDRPNKAAGLEINPVTDGYVVYQAEFDRVHYLNQAAAIVFELCNGRNDVADLVRMVGEAWDLTSPPTEEVVECVDALRQSGLIR